VRNVKLEEGSRVLNNRYRLVRRLNSDGGEYQGCETWVARDEDETEYLLKAWPAGGEPNLVLRAIWDRELRVLYRASSSAGSDSCLLVVREGLYDREASAFILLTEGPGYETLASALRDRANVSWLKPSTLKQREGRSSLWKGLRKVALGIRALHGQQILHRAVAPESVYMDLEDGPRSMRLGAFEWSVRVGATAREAPGDRWYSPPEIIERSGGHTFDSDWYGFGMLVARCMVSAEGWRDLDAERRRAEIYREVGASTALSHKEKDLIRRLIEQGARARLTYVEEVLRLIDEVIASLRSSTGAQESRPLHLVFAASNTRLVDALQERGFQPNPEAPDQPFSPRDTRHVASLREFLRLDIKGGLVFGMTQTDRCVLRGKSISLLLRPYQLEGGASTWEFAHVSHVVGLSADEENFRPISLGEVPISVLTPREVATARAKGVRSWEPLIPRVDEEAPLGAALARFQDFLRCTNQLDLLLRDGEIAAYEVVKQFSSESGAQRIEIRERERPRQTPGFCTVNGGLIELLQRELDSEKRNCERVFLTEEDALLVSVNVVKDWWEIESTDPDKMTVTLRRELMEDQAPLPQTGYLRTYGQYAAVTLVRRRTDAIDRLQEHSYLLRALAQPGQVFMDTQITELPKDLDPKAVDESKKAVIQDVLRVRPLYALQGPPGTGKTTLVAHLLRQILTEDPVAQILVTAPGHGAVDVLRGKVRDEVFAGAREEEKPLAVRLGQQRRGTGVTPEGSVSQVTRELLARVAEQLFSLASRSPTQEAWRTLVLGMLSSAKAEQDSAPTEARVEMFVRDLADTEELVKRSASITYCTTSAFDLEELAKGNHSFDWSIVEEAGKSHGFDLALPLQAGHRWLLLGDQSQLPPYRIGDYADGLSELGAAVDALSGLPARSQQLVDRDWINRWSRYSEQERAEFQKFCQTWLRTFGTLFNNLRDGIYGDARVTVSDSVGAATGRLSVQYRMHPTIGSMISKAFYQDFGGIRNATEDEFGAPNSKILHSITNPIDMRGKAIVWIDTPWCVKDSSFMEDDSTRYSNPKEVEVVEQFLRGLASETSEIGEVAVLSPYTAQVRALRKQLNYLLHERRLRFQQSIQREGTAANLLAAHTVDSFQGNEADVVVVSMTRNNTNQPGSGLGFLREDSARINVLLSRAQKLLVIIGSWDFFKTQVSHVPLADSVHELWSLRTALDSIESAVIAGTAIRIDAASLGRGTGR
jgi:hypothetical protein